ncbi:MAG: hypothetical protein U9O66_02260 [Patescibacteria group bacterium]|nr:hypothetical protein [Patescibacteria group bacterium]
MLKKENKVSDRFDNLVSEIADIKSELSKVKKTFTKKADLGKVVKLEERIKIVEMELLRLRTA